MGGEAARAWGGHVDAVRRGLRRTAVLALGCNVLLEVAGLLAAGDYPWRFRTLAFPLMFLLGSVVIWLVVGLLHAVLGRLRLTAAVSLSVTVVIAIADLEKLRLRREPLLPSDTEFAGELGLVADMLRPGILLALVLAAVLVFATVLAVARHMSRRRELGAAAPLGRRARTGYRALTGVLCLLSLSYLGGFNTPGNAARGAYDTLGAQWRPWSQQRNYLGNGFVGGFLYNLDVPPVSAPPGYGEAAMERIAARYADLAVRVNREREGTLADVNVVMVLSESFTDPLALDGLTLGEDPIPFTRGLMRSTTSGSMLAQAVGGGTANMEFEALTGMSMAQLPPQITSPYQMLVPKYSSFPSAVRWFEQAGHRSVAIHPFTTEMYRRRDVYRTFGFDEFVHAGSMRHTDRSGHGGYVSDAAAFDELVLRLRREPRSLFVNLVTMQNHMPYPGRYDDPVPVTGPGDARLSEIGHYARGLAHTDQALRRLIADLKRVEEPTVLVFYGDHQPGSYPEAVFEANGRAAMHQTPFFVWASFPGVVEQQPVTSPTHFVDLVLEQADARVPPYYALLDLLREQVPAMDAGMWFGPEGRRLGSPTSARVQRLLRDYRLVQYDLSAGERFSVDTMFGAPPT